MDPLKRLALLAVLAVFTACAESPTQPTASALDAPPVALANANAADVFSYKADVDVCYQPIPGFDAFTLCVVQNGMVRETITKSGVSSFSVINMETALSGYWFGELSFSIYADETAHTLSKDGDVVQVHQSMCLTDFVDPTMSFTTLWTLANGEVRHSVESSEGCGEA